MTLAGKLQLYQDKPSNTIPRNQTAPKEKASQITFNPLLPGHVFIFDSSARRRAGERGQRGRQGERPALYLPTPRPRTCRGVDTAACAQGQGALHEARGAGGPGAKDGTREHLKSQAAAFKGTAGPGPTLCAAPRCGLAAGGRLRGAADWAMLTQADPRRRGWREARAAHGAGRARGVRDPQAQPGAQVRLRPRGLQARAGWGRGGPEARHPGHRAGSPAARARVPTAAAQKCRRAKKLTPAWPPSPSTPPRLLPPSFPGPARRRRRRGRCFFFKAAPPSPGSAPLQAGLEGPAVHGSPAVPGGPEGDLQRPPRACGPIFPFKPGVSPPLARPAAYRLALRPPPPPENGPRPLPQCTGRAGLP
ncbi:uncharacterized protein LOC144367614 [Ictidomys tridecemlineatus]